MFRRCLVLIAYVLMLTSAARADDLQGFLTATDDGFDRMISGSKLPVVVMFWAEWCGPCRMMTPALQSAQSKMQGKVTFAKLNVDSDPKTASKYSIMSIPTVIIFKGGKQASTQVGAAPEAKLIDWINATVAATAPKAK